MLLLTIIATSLNMISADYRSPHSDHLLYFEMKPIDLEASGSYSLLLRDIDKDGNDDIVLMSYAGTTSGDVPGEVYWYHWDSVDQATMTPQWTKRLLSKKKHVVHGSFLDVNGDGYDDIVFNSDFEVPPEDVNPQGAFWCALNPGPNNYDTEWETTYIGRIVGNHRTATGDFDGDGLLETIAIPLFSEGVEPYYGPATLTLYEPPRPWSTTSPWGNYTLSEGFFLNPHDVAVIPTTGYKDAIMISAHEGIYRLDMSRTEDGSYTTEVTMLHDFPVDDPLDATARDVGVKPLPQNCDPNPDDLHGVTALTKNVPNIATLPYLATIDYTNTTGILPGQVWHGDQVSVYFPAPGKTVVDPGLTRHVLDKRYSGGHTVAVVDFDGDNCADVVAGFREYPTALMLYRCEVDSSSPTGVSFRKQIISERGTNDILISDFDRDGYLDMVSVGFGGMSGEDGDPYVLMWLYRGDSLSSSGTSKKSTHDDDSNPTGIVIGLSVLVVVLAGALVGLGIVWYRERTALSRRTCTTDELERNLLGD